MTFYAIWPLFKLYDLIILRFTIRRCSFFPLQLSAGAYYPAQPQFTQSVQTAPVIISPAQQPQQAPPPQQPPAQPQGPPKRERKPVGHHDQKGSGCRLPAEVKTIEWTEPFVLSMWNVLFCLKNASHIEFVYRTTRLAVKGELCSFTLVYSG